MSHRVFVGAGDEHYQKRLKLVTCPIDRKRKRERERKRERGGGGRNTEKRNEKAWKETDRETESGQRERETK